MSDITDFGLDPRVCHRTTYANGRLAPGTENQTVTESQAVMTVERVQLAVLQSQSQTLPEVQTKKRQKRQNEPGPGLVKLESIALTSDSTPQLEHERVL